MRKTLTLLLVFSYTLINYIIAQNATTGIQVVEFLSSEKLEGRLAGSSQDKIAAAFLSTKLRDYGLSSFWPENLQVFDIESGIELDSDFAVLLNDKELKANLDFLPFSFSGDANIEGAVEFVHDLQDSSVHVDGKTILYRLKETSSVGLKYRELVELGIFALQRGAGALIIVSDNNLGHDHEFYPLVFNRSVSKISIPVLQISRETLVQVMRQSGFEADDYSNEVFDFLMSGEIKLDVNLNYRTVVKNTESYNIAGFVGNSSSNDWIVVGAHYDHLGYGGYGSGSRRPDAKEIHNGADDNASGVAVVLMLAEYFAKNPAEVNLAFVLFGAEEQGLIGSKYFVDHLPDTIKSIKTMLNYDMVGRLSDGGLSVMGATSAVEFDSLLNIFQSDTLKLIAGGGGFSGSDQASFYTEKIPVLFFSTGMHSDYHTPDDDIEKINFAGLHSIAKFSVLLIEKLGDENVKLNFLQDQQSQQARHGGEMKVKLGIMPDMTSRNSDGLGVDGVTAGGVAEKAGIVKGDKIVKLDGIKIGGIYEYMNAMSGFEQGQKVKAIVVRNGEEIEIELNF